MRVRLNYDPAAAASARGLLLREEALTSVRGASKLSIEMCYTTQRRSAQEVEGPDACNDTSNSQGVKLTPSSVERGYGLVVPFHACGFALWFRITKTTCRAAARARTCSFPFHVVKRDTAKRATVPTKYYDRTARSPLSA